MMKRILKRIGFKNKILFSTLIVILLLCAGITVAIQFVLLPALTGELQRRGIAIAQSIADRSRAYILTQDKPNLETLVFDAALLEERKRLISYIFILGAKDDLLSHTFSHAFPEELHHSNLLPPHQPHSIRLLRVKNQSAYDVAVPIMEGIYQIGTVHVGLNERHIESLINKMGITLISVVAAIIILGILISNWLSEVITRPIAQLIKVSDEISRGNMDPHQRAHGEVRCWDVNDCEKEECPARKNPELPCWYVDGTECDHSPGCNEFPEKLQACLQCSVYRKHVGDEIVQLADSFNHMTCSLKASQERLKDSEWKYHSLFDSGPNPVFVIDRKTLEILDANPSAERVYGFSKTELIGRSFRELAPLDDASGDLGNLLPGDQPGPFLVRQKTRHFRKGNKPFYVNVHASPTKYQERDALILATTDITEMIEKDAQLIQASKMTTLGELSAGIAHELNQPLNAIKMGSEFLKMMMDRDEKIPEEQVAEVVGEVSNQVDRAAEIINRLRAFGRKADLSREKVNVNKSINDVLAIVGRQLALQNIEVHLDLQESVPSIIAHSNRLEQVIFNLVTNARDALLQKREIGQTSEPASIAIRTFQEGDRVGLAIRDTGIGMSEALKDRIFEPFFTTKEVGKGMGLGLSIAYGILRDYGGEISVQSEEGVGTAFTLTFPWADSL
ncbi:MAG: hypothetical protein QG552_795 [Thermodesulfobacteriota bacterium]|nr:hypothetical protein [Thermodesulfobacteriota bacterium]